MRLPPLALLALSLVACSTTGLDTGSVDAVLVELERRAQRELAVTTRNERQNRLEELYWPLRIANTELCAERSGGALSLFGFGSASLEDFDAEERDAASSALGVTDYVTVVRLVAGGPAELAGLERGDVVVALAGEVIPEGTRGTRRVREILEEHGEEPLEVAVMREGTPGSFLLKGVHGCRFPILLMDDPIINAFADGESIWVTAGMLRFAESDRELQLVIAHEMGHNIENHSGQAVAGALIGGLLGALLDAALSTEEEETNLTEALAGWMSRVNSQDHEREADYLAMYVLARTGISTVGVAGFWRRMAQEKPHGIEGSHSASHPSTPERYVRLEGYHQEIQSKSSAGQPLLPNTTGNR